jgi:Ca2+-transporting ATPase
MRVTVSQQDKVTVYYKGAPEILLARCGMDASERLKQQELAEKYAAQGLRILALAWSEGESENNLKWIGLVLLWDPPRDEVPDPIANARNAGIRVLMLTGDHPSTALSIAKQIGGMGTLPPNMTLIATAFNYQGLQRVLNVYSTF